MTTYLLVFNYSHHHTQLTHGGLQHNTILPTRNRGSYMNAHVLLNLLNELGEKDKMWGFAEHLIGFPQQVQ